MRTSAALGDHRIADVRFDDSLLAVSLRDGRTISVPISWYPALLGVNADVFGTWVLSDDEYGIRWTELGLFLTAEELLRGTAAPTSSLAPENEMACPQREPSSSGRRQTITAYIISDHADCRYAPEISSAIRITPPYGSAVEIVATREGWVKVNALSKLAWIESVHLSEVPPLAKRATEKVEVLTSSATGVSRSLGLPTIEVGPRGGVYTRTAKGFRRYY